MSLENGGIALGNGGVNLPDIRSGDANEFGETAVAVNADDLQILADVRLAHGALAAVAATDVHFRADEFAGLHARDIGADPLNRAAEFVAKGHRRMDARSRPAVPSVNVQVRAADGGGANADEHVVGANRRNGNLFERRAGLGARLAERLHRGGGHALALPFLRQICHASTGRGARPIGWTSFDAVEDANRFEGFQIFRNEFQGNVTKFHV